MCLYGQTLIIADEYVYEIESHIHNYTFRQNSDTEYFLED